MTEYRAITVRQPWAWALTQPHPADHEECLKDVENRPRRFRYRGLLLIHAAKQVDPEGKVFVERQLGAGQEEQLGGLPVGAIIGAVTVVGCCLRHGVVGPWATGPWCIKVRQPVRFREPIPCRGSLAMPWRVPAELGDRVAAQLN